MEGSAPGFALWVELGAVFLLLPLLLRLNILPIQKLLALGLGCGYALWVLLRDPAFDRRCLTWCALPARLWGLGLIRCGLLAGLMLLATKLLYPSLFLALVRKAPQRWVLILMLYPWLSAYPQELLYRVFFFHRYRKLLGEAGWLVAVNALLFAHMHLIYRNLPAILLSLAAGWMFALTYRRTRSLPAVFAEHALVGMALFTSGLGAFFRQPG